MIVRLRRPLAAVTVLAAAASIGPASACANPTETVLDSVAPVDVSVYGETVAWLRPISKSAARLVVRDAGTGTVREVSSTLPGGPTRLTIGTDAAGALNAIVEFAARPARVYPLATASLGKVIPAAKAAGLRRAHAFGLRDGKITFAQLKRVSGGWQDTVRSGKLDSAKSRLVDLIGKTTFTKGQRPPVLVGSTTPFPDELPAKKRNWRSVFDTAPAASGTVVFSKVGLSDGFRVSAQPWVKRAGRRSLPASGIFGAVDDGGIWAFGRAVVATDGKSALFSIFGPENEGSALTRVDLKRLESVGGFPSTLMVSAPEDTIDDAFDSGVPDVALPLTTGQWVVYDRYGYEDDTNCWPYRKKTRTDSECKLRLATIAKK